MQTKTTGFVHILKLPIALLIVLVSLSTSQAALKNLLLDGFDYSTDAELTANWKHDPLTQAPKTEMGDGMADQAAKFLFPGATLTSWRVYFDSYISHDLREYDRLEIKLKVDNPSALTSVNIYFEVEGGWYTLAQLSGGSDWSTITIPLVSEWDDGSPVSWENVKRIRLSLNPGAAKEDTYLHVTSIQILGGYDVQSMGEFGPFKTYNQAVSEIFSLKVGHDLESEIDSRLQEADSIFQILKDLDMSDKNNQTWLGWGKRLLEEAWTLSQPKNEDRTEMRGLWCHYAKASGCSYGTDNWDDALAQLRTKGLNAIFPNIMWSGYAAYPSDINIYVDTADGDQIAQVVAAGKKHNVEVHIWKVMFQIPEGWISPKGTADPFREANRLQISSTGDTATWLSLCDTANINYEINSIAEVLTNYDIDGFHLDYIRYQGDKYDYNTKCQAPFENYLGSSVTNWPQDVISGSHKDAYAEWKIEQVTQVVRDIRRVVDSINPSVELSAAVFANYSTARSWVSQDWPTWMADSLLDFLAPMNYTNSTSNFEANLNTELELSNNIPVYSGIGSFDEMPLSTLTEQINITREKNTGGFILFAQDAELYNYTIPFLEASALKGTETTLNLKNYNEDNLWDIDDLLEVTPILIENITQGQPYLEGNSLFPNQTNSVVHIFTVTGELVKSYNTQLGSSISLQDFNKGLYILKTQDRNFRFTVK
ncbi:family 10 glycosylhydrolase [bacterium]|nr:family 10 glycosylhydrolase [bacterium]